MIGERWDVAGLAALVSGLRATVGNDSGPMQTAARFGTPVVAIFGPTDPHRTGPLGIAHKVLRGTLSRDSTLGVSVDDTLEAVLECLDCGSRVDS